MEIGTGSAETLAALCKVLNECCSVIIAASPLLDHEGVRDDLRLQLSEMIFESFVQGERNPDTLKRIMLQEWGLAATVSLTPDAGGVSRKAKVE